MRYRDFNNGLERAANKLGLLSLGLLLLWSPAIRAQSSPPGRTRGPVDYTGPVRVIDGDSVEVYPDGNQVGVGFIGIQAPPGNTDCGKAATAALQQLVKGGLYLAEDPDLVFDARLRRLYYPIARDNRKIPQQLVTAGLAHSTHQGKDKDELDADEADASAHGRGCLHGGNPHLAAAENSTAATDTNSGAPDSTLTARRPSRRLHLWLQHQWQGDLVS
jgi:endonuclease YncB( thermonuclease family)